MTLTISRLDLGRFLVVGILKARVYRYSPATLMELKRMELILLAVFKKQINGVSRNQRVTPLLFTLVV